MFHKPLQLLSIEMGFCLLYGKTPLQRFHKITTEIPHRHPGELEISRAFRRLRKMEG
jgi:hypothetical protein